MLPPPADLSLVTTDLLVAELAKRYETMTVCGIDLDENIHVYLHGSSIQCSGLLTHAQNEILWASFSQRPL